MMKFILTATFTVSQGFAVTTIAEPAPAPTPTVLQEPGVDIRAPLPPKLPRPTRPKPPLLPAGPTPLDSTIDSAPLMR